MDASLKFYLLRLPVNMAVEERKEIERLKETNKGSFQ
jgi:hypothetical protein